MSFSHIEAAIDAVRRGEIVGIAGVSGNGQQELMKALSGETPLADAGAVTLMGMAAGCMNAAERRAKARIQHRIRYAQWISPGGPAAWQAICFESGFRSIL